MSSQPPEQPGPRRRLNYVLQRRVGADDAQRPQRWNWSRAYRPFDRTIERQAQQPLAEEQTKNLRFFWWDGIFAATSEAFYLAYIPLFALAYGATNQQVGWITAVGNLLGALALFPGARLMERIGRRKEIVLWSGGGIARVALLLMAFVPLLGLPPTAAIIAITTLNGLRAFMANFANPPWTAMVADIVPEFMRGRYFSTRNLTMGVATLIFAALAGWLISAGNAWTADPYLGYQLVFVLAFATGMMSTWSFSRIAEPQRKVAAAAEGGAGRRAEIMQSPGFIGFVISAFIWNFSLQIAGPFFNVYLVTHLGAGTGMVGLATSASSLAALGGQLLFGRLMDRKGAIWLSLVTGFPIVILPMLWALYTDPGQVVVNNLFGGFLWAGYNLANFNLLLQLTPDRQRGHAVALYQTAVFVSAVFGPLVGGFLADNVSFKLIFIVSGLGRLVGLLVFIWLSVLPLRAMRQARGAAGSG